MIFLPSASATALDGHPLAARGEAGRALGVAVTASFVGGMFSFLCLYFIAPVLADIALKFRSPDLFSLVLFGLTIICSFAAQSVVKGLLAAVIGLMIVTIGQDPIVGTQRYTFGQVNLIAGIHFLTALIGLFAIPQLVDNFADIVRSKSQAHPATRFGSVLPRLSDLKRIRLPVAIGAPVGAFLGILPGAGGPIAAFIDIVGDFAIGILVGGGVPTINLRIDYLKPAVGEALTASARVRRRGRTVAVIDIDVVDAKGSLVAIGRGTYSPNRG